MNGLTPPKSGAAEWPPGPTPRPSRGAPEPSDNFAGILDSHQARTANAEGQNRSPKTEGRNRRDNDGPVANDRAEARSNARWARERREADGVERERPVQHHEDDPQAKPANPGDAVVAPNPVADGQRVVPQEQPVQPVQPAAASVVTAEAVVAPQVPAVETQTQTQTQVAQAQVAQAPTQTATVAAQAAVVQAPVQQPEQQDAPVQAPAQAVVADAPKQRATVQADEAATAPVVQQQQEQPEAKPADGKQPVQSAQVAAPKPKESHSENGQGQQDQPQQQGTLPEQAADRARTVAQGYARTQHANTEVPTTAQSGTPAASPVTQVSGGQPAAARGELAPATPVPLARAAETVEHVLRLASNRGVTHARIALTPESLGSIDVHLRHTADGVVAKVVAHSAESVQQLQQAATDLRQQLEGQGVNLLSLDIGHSAADEGSAARAGAGFGDEDRGNSRGRADGGDAAAADAETIVNSTLRLPNGVLVDVLA